MSSVTVVATHEERGIVAAKDFAPGEPVQRWRGSLVPSFTAVPVERRAYAFQFGAHEWLIPECELQYMNHGCQPNCMIDHTLTVIALRPIRRGEALTIDYGLLQPPTGIPEPWHEEWTFACWCRSSSCRGTIDSYSAAPRSYFLPAVI